MIHNTHSVARWLFNTQSRVLQADWLILENNEKATFNINMPCIYIYIMCVEIPVDAEDDVS